jgi:hypothetical protein
VQSTLNSLQDRVLGVVAAVGGWTLTGGGALAGVYLGHRTTEDLDLFLYDARSFDREPGRVLAPKTREPVGGSPLIACPFDSLSI